MSKVEVRDNVIKIWGEHSYSLIVFKPLSELETPWSDKEIEEFILKNITVDEHRTAGQVIFMTEVGSIFYKCRTFHRGLHRGVDKEIQ